MEKDIMGCIDRGYFEMAVQFLAKKYDTVISDNTILSILQNGHCRTFTTGSVVTIKQIRDRTEKIPATVCVTMAGTDCYWMIAGRNQRYLQ